MGVLGLLKPAGIIKVKVPRPGVRSLQFWPGKASSTDLLYLYIRAHLLKPKIWRTMLEYDNARGNSGGGLWRF